MLRGGSGWRFCVACRLSGHGRDRIAPVRENGIGRIADGAAGRYSSLPRLLREGLPDRVRRPETAWIPICPDSLADPARRKRQELTWRTLSHLKCFPGRRPGRRRLAGCVV